MVVKIRPLKVMTRMVSVRHFTTGEAAELCGVSQQTIIRNFDSGELKGFRVPLSAFRRIPRESLRAFMLANGIPTGPLDAIEPVVEPAGAPAPDPGLAPAEEATPCPATT
jgi:excisionase family DNA binding protein